MKCEVQQIVQKHEDDKKKHRSHVNENRQEEKRKRVSKFRPPPTPPTAIPLSTAQTRGAVQQCIRVAVAGSKILAKGVPQNVRLDGFVDAKKEKITEIFTVRIMGPIRTMSYRGLVAVTNIARQA